MKQKRTGRAIGGYGLLVLGLLAGMTEGSATGAEVRMDAPSQSMVSVAPGGWTAGIHYRADGRELKGAGDVVELDADVVVAELGYEVAPFLQLAGQAGWTKADLGDESGENGLAWAAIARANLAEYVLRESPEVGRQEWLGAGLEVQYRSNESNQDTADVNWAETLVVPSVYYFRNHRGDALQQEYHATGYGLRVGLAFSFIDGELGSTDLEENRNFGFVLGGTARMGGGWAARLRATVFGSGDQNLEVGALYHF